MTEKVLISGKRAYEYSARLPQSIYDRIGPQIFSYFGQRLVDLADLGSGGKVLDVAAGRGAVLFPVAASVEL